MPQLILIVLLPENIESQNFPHVTFIMSEKHK
jgi:hypothetical protein